MGLGLETLPNDQQSTTDFIDQLFIPLIVRNPCNCYYLDSVNGSDTNPGTSEDRPWKSLVPVHSKQFDPGSVVYFKRGSTWTGGLFIDSSGVENNPIRFTAYGEGDRPTFENPGDGSTWASAIFIDADWVILEDILVKNAHDAGVYIANGSDHNIVNDIEATNVGIGVTINGQHNLVTNSYLHDLNMINNTPGGDDDHGAVGVLFSNSYNEASFNTIVNCIAPSYDYGVDGGAFEWFGVADGNYVHHNWAMSNDGFLEVGGGSARNTLVSYNISVGNTKFSVIHLGGKFASQVDNFRIENNTIVETRNGDLGWVILSFNQNPSPNTLSIRNNIFYTDGYKGVSNFAGFNHDHNLYYLGGGSELGFRLNQTELISDPLFRDLRGLDFHLNNESPALNAGTDLGHMFGFDGNRVPDGVAPELGAYEFMHP